MSIEQLLKEDVEQLRQLAQEADSEPMRIWLEAAAQAKAGCIRDGLVGDDEKNFTEQQARKAAVWAREDVAQVAIVQLRVLEHLHFQNKLLFWGLLALAVLQFVV